MRAYTEQQLNQKIQAFMTKRTEKFPELRDGNQFKQKDGYGQRVINRLEKASVLWGKYIHA